MVHILIIKTSLLKRSYDRDLPETTSNQIDQKAVCIHQDYSLLVFSVNGIALLDRFGMEVGRKLLSLPALPAGITMYETEISRYIPFGRAH